MYDFKPNPKAQVEIKFRELFGGEHRVEVRGKRVTAEEAKRSGVKCLSRDGTYASELIVDGESIAQASHSDWRKSYKLLKAEVEKLYADGTALV